MRWTLKLNVESDSGEAKTHEVARWERAEVFIKTASLGLSLEEGKQFAANIQAQMVSEQVEQHNKALTVCCFCGRG